MKSFAIITLGLLLSTVQAFSQKGVEDGSRYGQGEDSIRCLRNLSLYDELVKQDRYDDAFPYWEIVFNECPQSTRNIYTHGVEIMSHKIKTADNQADKDKYFKVLMNVYDQRIQYFGDHPRYGVPYIKGLKAIDMLEYKKEDAEIRKEAYELLLESIEGGREATQPAVFAVFMTNTVVLFNDGEIGAEDVVNNYTTVIDLLNAQIESPKMARYKDTLEDLAGKIEELFARSGAADCSTLDRIFSPQLEEHKDDLPWLTRVSRLLAREMCEDMDLLYKVSEYQHQIEPSHSSAYGLARMYLKRDETARSVEFFEEAINLVDQDEQKAKYYYQLGLVHLSQNNFSEARSDALKALEFNPEWGQPYILIGKAYATSANSIGDDEFTHKTAYWAAVDKFNRAKSVDPSVADEADDLIRIYRQHFPEEKVVFFQNLEKGESYTVGGWIGERTTVRAK